jgi:F0F1-type ATP synthase assembly protein I
MEIITKTLVTMSSGLLMDHFKNTTSMDLIIFFIKRKFPFTAH